MAPVPCAAPLCQYPRWHSHEKVLRDLRQHGRVITYQERPDDAEGNAVYQRAMDNERKALALGATPLVDPPAHVAAAATAAAAP